MLTMADVDEYGNLHRAVLQTLMGHGTIKTDVLINIFTKLLDNFMPDQAMEPNLVDKVIEMINEKISPYDQKISKHDYDLTSEEFYVFHSTAKTSMSKFQNVYKEDELDYFKLILTKIVENEELSISPRGALNLCLTTPGKINKLRAEKLLDNWIQCSYFCKHTDSQIYLGAKVLTEFKELLQSLELDYLKTCILCENIAIWGERCASCGIIYHSKCIRKFLTRSDKCPSCKETWAVPAAN